MDEHVASRTIVVAGLGMVALSFIEKVREYDLGDAYTISVFSEEPHGNRFLFELGLRSFCRL